MPNVLFGPEIRLMLADDDTAGLRALSENLHPATMADALDDFAADDIWTVLAPSDPREQAAIFEYLPSAVQIEMMRVDRPQVGGVIAKMSHDDRVDLLRRVPTSVREKLLRVVDEADRKDIATLVEYGSASVGAIMTTDYAWLPPTMTTAEAIDQLRQQAPDRETIYYVYVLDELRRRPDSGAYGRKLLGIISLRDLILAPRDAVIRDLMTDEVVSLRHDDPAEKAGQVLARYDFIAVPVVDADGGMLGIVTHDDIIDVIQEEATEDLQRQAGVGPIEGNYLEASYFTVWWSRIQWLVVLFVFQMVTIYVMTWEEKKLSVSAALIVCLPLVMSVGGNAGSQAATLVVRALSLGQVTPRLWGVVLGREIIIGGGLAVTLGLVTIVRTQLATPSDVLTGPTVLYNLTWVLSLTVMAVCLCGTLLGSLLPLFIRWAGWDPALVSSPAIATLSDVAAILIYATIASQFFTILGP